MKSALLALLFVASLHALTLNVPYYKNSERTTGSVDLTLPGGWKHSPTAVGSSTGDYLLTSDKTVYFTGSLWYDSMQSEAGFKSARKRNGGEPHAVGDITVYSNAAKNGDAYRSYTFSRYLGDGFSFLGSIFPYPGHEKQYPKAEFDAMLKIFASVEVPTALRHTIVAASDDAWMQDRKFKRVKKKIDAQLSRAKASAQAGAFGDIRHACNKIDAQVQVLEMLNTEIPEGFRSYVNDAVSECRGPVFVEALRTGLDKQGGAACESIEVTLLTTSLDAVPEAPFKAFQKAFRQTCPGKFAGNR